MYLLLAEKFLIKNNQDIEKIKNNYFQFTLKEDRITNNLLDTIINFFEDRIDENIEDLIKCPKNIEKSEQKEVSNEQKEVEKNKKKEELNENEESEKANEKKNDDQDENKLRQIEIKIKKMELLIKNIKENKKLQNLLLNLLMSQKIKKEELQLKLNKIIELQEGEIDTFFNILKQFESSKKEQIKDIRRHYRKQLENDLKYSLNKEEEMLERFPFLKD